MPTVKVKRFLSGKNDADVYNGCFFSQVYAIKDSKMLVYDNGKNTLIREEKEHFEWVRIDDTAVIDNEVTYIVTMEMR